MRFHHVCAAVVSIAAWPCAAGCNALSGVDDLVAADEGAGAPDARADAASALDGGHQHDPDTGSGTVSILDASGDAAATLCTGLSVVIPFDGTALSLQGDAPAGGAGGATYAPGKFGQALAFDGALDELDYDAQSGARVSATEGTISMWVDSTWELPCTREHDFFSVDDGVYMDCEPNGILGVYYDLTPESAVSAVLPPATGKGSWTAGYNHLVATWSEAAPGFRIVLNGSATSAVTSDWTPRGSIAKTLYIGEAGFGPSAAIDDVAVWKRALSPAEIAAITAAGRPIADVCGVK